MKEIYVSSSVLEEMWETAYAINKHCWLKVMSNSMFPIMEAGDRVFVEFIPPSCLAPGDIVTYRVKPSIFMTHRIVRRILKDGEFYFYEKPDRGIYVSLISQKAIIGKITKIQKGNRIFPLDNSLLGFFNNAMAFYSLFIFHLHKTLSSGRSTRKDHTAFRTSTSLARILRILPLIPGKIF